MSWKRKLALFAVGLAVAFIGWHGIVQRLGTSDVSLPQRIVVTGREYDQPVTVDVAETKSGSGQWRQVGVMDSTHQPIYAWVIAGAAPTAVFVQLTPSAFVEYALVGGP